MESADRILLHLYFPMFSCPDNSRFISLFHSLNKKNKSKKEKGNELPYNIYPEKIIQGLDKRSSIVIKNIPKTWKKNAIRKLVETYGNINYLYLEPDDYNKTTNCVYINLVNYKSIVNIFMSLRKMKFYLDNKIVYAEIYYSEIQGKQELIKNFKEQ